MTAFTRLRGIALTLLVASIAPQVGAAQSCQLFAAALEAVGATAGTTVLVAETTDGIPGFAFNAYTSMMRGDTTLARLMMPLLKKANAQRVPVSSCLVDSLSWHTIADSTLFRIFRPDSGDAWTTFRRAFPATPKFALLSQPVMSADTATFYVAIASDHLNGVGKIVQLVRDGSGRWVKRSEVMLWVS
jgi:hypothetical protein